MSLVSHIIVLLIIISAVTVFLIDMTNYPDTNYEPLPLTIDEPISTFPSRGLAHGQIESPSTHELIGEDAPTPAFNLPPGAAAPRFLGAQPDVPHSYVSSQSSFPVSSSIYNSSGYALNPISDTTYMDNPDSSDQPEQQAPLSSADQSGFFVEKNPEYANPRPDRNRKRMFWIIIAGLGILLVLAAVLLAYFLVIKPKSQTSSSGSKTTATSAVSKPTTTSTPKAVTGGDGSTVTMEDGSTFVYRNSFGGYWHYDENDPFNNGARAQSWSPALNETFRYGIDQIRG